MPYLKAVLLGLVAASTTLAGPIVRPGSVDVPRAVMPRDSSTADPISVSLPVPVMDGQNDQAATAKSELAGDDSGGLEARQVRAAQPKKGGTRVVTGGRPRGGGTTVIATVPNGRNTRGGARVNPGILNAVSAPALPVTSGTKISGVILDNRTEDDQTDSKQGTNFEVRVAVPGGKTNGGGGRTTKPKSTTATTTTLTVKPEKISPDVIAQISRPAPLAITSGRKISDTTIGTVVSGNPNTKTPGSVFAVSLPK
ncbi:uncharacterized protein PgNI_09162 [Pyricularia grisea]|uniref:Uncharacterized protein n=1 Tax=Pyricularia grisea TaxID=148305 RepID=A0A6P8ARG8_PYRGI|nr:uncharacterized protein PgNI_09162 [Pyricularia grisea]TLD04700.1 hypothetical protein PgNI_09162 [Pyricularia grisea]